MQEEQSATQRQAEQRYVERPGVVRERWDCESVLSLRSNLDNHPASISQPPSSRRLRQQVIMTFLMTVLLLHILMTSNLSCPEEEAKTRAQSSWARGHACTLAGNAIFRRQDDSCEAAHSERLSSSRRLLGFEQALLAEASHLHCKCLQPESWH